MELVSYLLVSFLVFLAGIAFLAWWISRRLAGLSLKQADGTALTEWLKAMQTSLNETNQNVTTTLQRQFQTHQEQLKLTANEFAKMQREIGHFSEIGRAMRQLQEFIQSPKLRGNLGEEILSELLRQMLPRQSFHLQYSFKNGARVDACIQTELGILPIDAKFPLAAWREMLAAETEVAKNAAQKKMVKDIKTHIDNIAGKYILPEEGTMDLALMYIPSEPIFYEISHLDEILDYAREKKIVPVSPTTLYAYLQAILASFEQRQIMARSKEIFTLLQSLSHDYQKTERQLGVLARHIQNAFNTMSSVTSGFTLLGQKIASTKSLKSGEETD